MNEIAKFMRYGTFLFVAMFLVGLGFFMIIDAADRRLWPLAVAGGIVIAIGILLAEFIGRRWR